MELAIDIGVVGYPLTGDNRRWSAREYNNFYLIKSSGEFCWNNLSACILWVKLQLMAVFIGYFEAFRKVSKNLVNSG